LKLSDFDYSLPEELIAQTPVEPRHNARLLVLDRSHPGLEQTRFWDLGQFLRRGDLLVINQTRVIPARIFAAKRPGGGKVEILLLKKQDELTWEALVGGKGLNIGRELDLQGGLTASVIQVLDGPRRLIRFSRPLDGALDQIGQMPLPPYIHEPLKNPQRYQTVYAQQPGSAAAPTAGLHFTPELMAHLEEMGIGFARVTLHVGLDTFAPVTEDDPTTHAIHSEWCEVTAAAAELINRTAASGGRIIAVGTTSVRTLESAASTARPGDRVGVFSGPTRLFIYPGYHFRAVEATITNFHLPKSTLLMLVSAFAGRERILEAYEWAKQCGFRFYSFGDAMLIV
jgi:S-adenosylmethionine:tRNA ribosyltransferase-isomerase